MEDNAKMIHFHIKGRGMQSLVFVQITFENYATNLYKNGHCQFAILTSIKRFRIFIHFYTDSLSIKTCFYKTSNASYLKGIFILGQSSAIGVFNFIQKIQNPNSKSLAQSYKKQKQPSRGVLRKRYSKNMQQSYKRTPMTKCNFNKAALQLFSEHLFLRTPVDGCFGKSDLQCC